MYVMLLTDRDRFLQLKIRWKQDMPALLRLSYSIDLMRSRTIIVQRGSFSSLSSNQSFGGIRSRKACL
jgi:hypothetical protein